MPGLRALMSALRELRLSLELAKAPEAGQARAVDLCAIEPVALAGMPGLRLEFGEAAVDLAVSVSNDSDVLVRHELADLDPLEDKSCRWAEGKEKGPEDSRTPRILG